MMISESRRTRAHFDWQLLVAVYALSLFGIYCIASATYDPDKGTDLNLLTLVMNSRSSMWQSIFVLASPVVIALTVSAPLDLFRGKLTRVIYFAVVVLLLATLITATAVNGTRNWFNSGVGRAFQPAEFSKMAVLLALARHFTRSEKPMGTLKDFIRTLVIVGLPAGIVLLQGETGSVIVIGVMFIIMAIFSGADIRLIIGLVFVAALGIGSIIAYALLTGSTDYRILRLMAFTDPQSYYSSGGYQVLNSQKAIGSGQLTGVGAFTLGTVTQLGGVPENSTDFILATIGEAFGFAGICAVLGTYLFIILRMIYLARFTTDRYGRLAIAGVTGMLFFHVFQNISMCLGLMPITGIPLPFLSYGGSNYMTNIAGIGLVLNVTRSRSAAGNADPAGVYTEGAGIKHFLSRRGNAIYHRGNSVNS